MAGEQRAGQLTCRRDRRVNREHDRAEAGNQAGRALVLATGYLRNDGTNVGGVPEFADVTIQDNVRTAIRLVVEPDG